MPLAAARVITAGITTTTVPNTRTIEVTTPITEIIPREQIIKTRPPMHVSSHEVHDIHNITNQWDTVNARWARLLRTNPLILRDGPKAAPGP